jgi:hypothetical protein
MCGGTEARRSFQVVTTAGAFASLFSLYTLHDYLPAGRQAGKKTARNIYPALFRNPAFEVYE